MGREIWSFVPVPVITSAYSAFGKESYTRFCKKHKVLFESGGS